MESLPAWRSLRVGDRIRITALPDEIWAAHGETKALFERLVSNRVHVMVHRLDDDGYPWIEYIHKDVDGTSIYESLLIKHNEFELIGTI